MEIYCRLDKTRIWLPEMEIGHKSNHDCVVLWTKKKKWNLNLLQMTNEKKKRWKYWMKYFDTVVDLSVKSSK